MLEFIKVDFEFSDDRGVLKQLCHDGWRQVNYLFTKKGVFRGNHYHKENQEAFYIIDGEIDLVLEKDGKKEEYTVKTGDFFIIKPFAIHSMTFKKDTSMIALYDKGVEKDGKRDIFVPEK